MLTLETPLVSIPGVGPRFTAKLKQLNIQTVGDLLAHFPNRYEDFSQIYSIADLEPGQQATIQGTVEEVELRRTWRRHMTVVEAKIRDDSGVIRAVWFNQPYVKNVLKPGRPANFSGKVAVSEQDIYLSHPTYELLDFGFRSPDSKTLHTARLVPVYPETRGLTSKGIRFLVQPLLARLAPIPEWLPPEVRREKDLPEINLALRQVHFPERIEDAVQAKRRFAFEDLFLLQLLNLRHKLRLAREKAPAISTDVPWLRTLLAQLPFELTFSQKRSLWEILQDMDKPRPMSRLLQGDVGSGKTVVAALTALVAAENGYQTAIMAPTEVLAKQHFETFRKLFACIRGAAQPTLGLLTASLAKIIRADDREAETTKEKVRRDIRQGEIKIVIGTHALIARSKGQEVRSRGGIEFSNLGLVVIDEQHRFGVEQRALLVRGQTQNNTPTNAENSSQRKSAFSQRRSVLLPHFLSMSATPIPRTLMLTVFGDLDISTIDELPSGRKKIVTKIVSPASRSKAYQFIRQQIDCGRQTFVICPRIDPSQTNGEKIIRDPRQAKLWEVKSVKEEYEKLSRKVFPDLKVEMLHGQLRPKVKNEVMKNFRNGKINVLVSTSVVEVGVDVPNATIMMIEGADRFGLAQLYQFRGRVGRGEHQSFCFLFTESESRPAAARLKAIVEAKNGFELAERDLALRGPGEFLGQKQTGLPDVAMRGLQDTALIKTSREAAVKVTRTDPGFKKYPPLWERLREFEENIHLE